MNAPVLLRTRAEPFATVEAAVIWTMEALQARLDGARILSGAGLVQRPCEPDDVVKVLDRLYRQRRIELAHVRVLRIYGVRGMAPDPSVPREIGDALLWRGAIDALAHPLKLKGIVA